jgi:hypothetical protein
MTMRTRKRKYPSILPYFFLDSSIFPRSPSKISRETCPDRSAGPSGSNRRSRRFAAKFLETGSTFVFHEDVVADLHEAAAIAVFMARAVFPGRPFMEQAFGAEIPEYLGAGSPSAWWQARRNIPVFFSS